MFIHLSCCFRSFYAAIATSDVTMKKKINSYHLDEMMGGYITKKEAEKLSSSLFQSKYHPQNWETHRYHFLPETNSNFLLQHATVKKIGFY